MSTIKEEVVGGAGLVVESLGEEATRVAIEIKLATLEEN
jgi:hypothetical protein